MAILLMDDQETDVSVRTTMFAIIFQLSTSGSKVVASTQKLSLDQSILRILAGDTTSVIRVIVPMLLSNQFEQLMTFSTEKNRIMEFTIEAWYINISSILDSMSLLIQAKTDTILRCIMLMIFRTV